jgi:cyclophilin family peptidyl-prolyl cis-trans isomerase
MNNLSSRAALVLVLSLLSAVDSVLAGTLVQFRTRVGDIDVELFDEEKPETVRNFLLLTQQGRYQDVIFHRWDPNRNFVLQGGGFTVTNRGTTNAAFTSVQHFGTITNEYDVGETFSNTSGTIGMARIGGQTNSASSQWYFNLGDNVVFDGIDGGFTVFGRVIGDTNVLNLFLPPFDQTPVRTVNLGGALSTLPIIPDGTNELTFDDLLYVDVSLLQVEVEDVGDNDYTVSWNSVANRMHHIECTDQFPPVWLHMLSAEGTGERMQLLDEKPELTERFYRVRIDY